MHGLKVGQTVYFRDRDKGVESDIMFVETKWATLSEVIGGKRLQFNIETMSTKPISNFNSTRVYFSERDYNYITHRANVQEKFYEDLNKIISDQLGEEINVVSVKDMEKIIKILDKYIF